MKKTVLFGALAMASGLAAASSFTPTFQWDVVAQGSTVVSTMVDPYNPTYTELRTGAYSLPTTFKLLGTEPSDDSTVGEYVTYDLYADTDGTNNSVNLGALLTNVVLTVGQSFSYVLAANTQYVLKMTLTGDNSSSTRVSAVPVPGAALLFGTALLGAGVMGRKKLAEKRADAVSA